MIQYPPPDFSSSEDARLPSFRFPRSLFKPPPLLLLFTLVLLLPRLTLAFPFSSNSCPSPAVLHSTTTASTRRSLCYEYIDLPKTFAQADSYCANSRWGGGLGLGTLASFRSFEEYEFVRSLVQRQPAGNSTTTSPRHSSFWIGLEVEYDRSSSSQTADVCVFGTSFRWTDGHKVEGPDRDEDLDRGLGLFHQGWSFDMRRVLLPKTELLENETNHRMRMCDHSDESIKRRPFVMHRDSGKWAFGGDVVDESFPFVCQKDLRWENLAEVGILRLSLGVWGTWLLFLVGSLAVAMLTAVIIVHKCPLYVHWRPYSYVSAERGGIGGAELTGVPSGRAPVCPSLQILPTLNLLTVEDETDSSRRRMCVTKSELEERYSSMVYVPFVRRRTIPESVMRRWAVASSGLCAILAFVFVVVIGVQAFVVAVHVPAVQRVSVLWLFVGIGCLLAPCLASCGIVAICLFWTLCMKEKCIPAGLDKQARAAELESHWRLGFVSVCCPPMLIYSLCCIACGGRRWSLLRPEWECRNELLRLWSETEGKTFFADEDRRLNPLPPSPEVLEARRSEKERHETEKASLREIRRMTGYFHLQLEKVMMKVPLSELDLVGDSRPEDLPSDGSPPKPDYQTNALPYLCAMVRLGMMKEAFTVPKTYALKRGRHVIRRRISRENKWIRRRIFEKYLSENFESFRRAMQSVYAAEDPSSVSVSVELVEATETDGTTNEPTNDQRFAEGDAETVDVGLNDIVRVRRDNRY